MGRLFFGLTVIPRLKFLLDFFLLILFRFIISILSQNKASIMLTTKTNTTNAMDKASNEAQQNKINLIMF
jgi:hypothetical protein